MTAVEIHFKIIEHRGHTYVDLDTVMAILEAKLYGLSDTLAKTKLEVYEAVEAARRR